MILKRDRKLLYWIHNNIVDFTDENDESGLSWDSTHKEALKFMQSIPKKDRVQKYGFYSSTEYFILVESFDDIKFALENDIISKSTCKYIYGLNIDVGRDNWDMSDVESVLSVDMGICISRDFLKAHIQHLIDLEVIECVNSDIGKGRLYRLSEKGERILKEV